MKKRILIPVKCFQGRKEFNQQSATNLTTRKDINGIRCFSFFSFVIVLILVLSSISFAQKPNSPGKEIGASIREFDDALNNIDGAKKLAFREQGINIYDRLGLIIRNAPEPAQEVLTERLVKLYAEEQKEIDKIFTAPEPQGDNSSLQVGTNQTYTTANDGAHSGSDLGVSVSVNSMHERWNRRNDVGGAAIAWGSKSTWAWNGYRLSITGSGSRRARITFNNIYDRWHFESLQAGGSYSTYLQIWDTTTSPVVLAAERKIVDETMGFWAWSDINQTVSHSVEMTLEPGRQYVFRLITRGSVHAWTYSTSALNGGPNLSEHRQFRNTWDSISIRWL